MRLFVSVLEAKNPSLNFWKWLFSTVTSLQEELKHFWVGVSWVEGTLWQRRDRSIGKPLRFWSLLSSVKEVVFSIRKALALSKALSEHKAGVEFWASTSALSRDCEHQTSKVLPENKWLGRASWKFWSKCSTLCKPWFKPGTCCESKCLKWAVRIASSEK